MSAGGGPPAEKPAEKAMMDFQKHVMTFKMKVFTNSPIPDPKNLGIHMMTEAIPKMRLKGDMAFAWHWVGNDVCLYNQKEYDDETDSYKKKGLKKAEGDTTWFYDWVEGKSIKKCRAVMTTEIWFKEGADHNTSPFAILFGQMFGAGLHITKVRFEDL